MDDTSTPLLVAERDEGAREFLVDNLKADGFDASGAGGSGEARVKLAHFEPELLVLGELERPHAQLELLRGVRARGADWLPVVVLARERTELAELRAFREGCDDYLARPFAYPVLLARIGALLRRAKGGFIPRMRVGALEIDAVQRTATVAGEPLHLTPLEFDLVARLACEPTRVYSKWELLREVWGYKAEGNTRRKGMSRPRRQPMEAVEQPCLSSRRMGRMRIRSPLLSVTARLGARAEEVRPRPIPDS